MEYMYTKFGVNSSKCFSFLEHGHTVTDTADHPTHTSVTAGVVRLFVSSGVARLLAVYMTCFPPTAIAEA